MSSKFLKLDKLYHATTFYIGLCTTRSRDGYLSSQD